MFERITIKALAIELGYKDKRSVIKWCKNNGVRILKFIGSNKRYINKNEFERAISSAIHDENNHTEPEVQSTYHAQGNHEKSFLAILRSLD